MELVAQQVSISEEYGAVVLGFADDVHAPSQYILLQRTLEPDKQDQQLGHDRLHLQINEESKAGYCDIERAVLTRRRLSLLLTAETAKHLGIDGFVDIQLPAHCQELSAIEAACRKLFGEERFQLSDEL